MHGDRPEITRLLREWSAGDHAALSEVMSAVYEDLHRLGRRCMGSARPGHTLQPTAVVHEAFLQLLEQRRVHWRDREHFFAVMALLMRRTLQRHAERKGAEKRGAGRPALPLDDAPELASPEPAELAGLADALAELERLDPRQGRIVALRFFAGLTIDEIAREIGVAPITVKRDWRLARAWLRRELDRRNEDDST
jgi:RNA polymerase sigma factor (TIGR02999 family)